MKTRSSVSTGAVLAGLFILAPSAPAIPFDGQTLIARVAFGGFDPYPGTMVSFAVDSTPGAVEVPAYGAAATSSFDVFDVDATHASIIVRNLRTESFSYGPSPNLVVFNDAFGSIRDILSVSLGAVSWPDATAADIAFTSDSFSFDFGDMRIVEGDFFRLDITTAANATSVPETGSTAGPLGLAFGGIALLARKRSASANRIAH